MLPDYPLQTTLFVELAKDGSVGVGAAWTERDGWKPRAASLGKYITETDATIFAIDMALKQLPPILLRTSRGGAEIVTKSRSALTVIQDQNSWQSRTITEVKRLARRVEEKGVTLALTWLSSSSGSHGYKAASAAAQQAAKQSPKTMRSASLLYVKQAVKERWKRTLLVVQRKRTDRGPPLARVSEVAQGTRDLNAKAQSQRHCSQRNARPKKPQNTI